MHAHTVIIDGRLDDRPFPALPAAMARSSRNSLMTQDGLCMPSLPPLVVLRYAANPSAAAAAAPHTYRSRPPALARRRHRSQGNFLVVSILACTDDAEPPCNNRHRSPARFKDTSAISHVGKPKARATG